MWTRRRRKGNDIKLAMLNVIHNPFDDPIEIDLPSGRHVVVPGHGAIENLGEIVPVGPDEGYPLVVRHVSGPWVLVCFNTAPMEPITVEIPKEWVD